MAVPLLERIRNFILTRRDIAQRSPLVYNVREYTQNERIRHYMEMIAAPFVYLKSFFVNTSIEGREGLAFVLIAKNEAPYIEEWINFHHKQGASHFFIYDNESTDNLIEVLTPYIKQGLVTYRALKGKLRQNDAYNMAIHNYGRKFRYMAFVDTDEFVYVRDESYREKGFNLYDFVDDFMKSHENAGGMAVNWCIFGSGGRETKPDGGVLENYTIRSEDNFCKNLHIKTICDPMKVFYYGHCHFPTYRKGFYSLNENGEIVIGPFTTKVSFCRIRINHYFTKSREEYILKKNRGRADADLERTMEDFYEYDQNIIHDTEILSRI